MGASIAETIEAAGISVILKDLGSGYGGLGDVELVIEAVAEGLELGQEVFAELDQVTPGGAILASSTSSLSITELGHATIRPDKVVGLHFFHPATKARVVEVVAGESTSPETIQAATAFVQRIRRVPIRCLDAPGFAVNRILLSAISEAWRHQLDTGVEPAEIDIALVAGRPDGRGPFRLADEVGLDTTLHIAQYLQGAYGDRFAVHPRLRELLAEGHFGNELGQGHQDDE